MKIKYDIINLILIDGGRTVKKMINSNKTAIKIGSTVMAAALLLGGCNLDPMPELTEEERGQISEYAVGMLMKYDSHHQSRFLDPDDLDIELTRLETLANNKVNSEVYARQTKAASQKEKEDKKKALEETPIVSENTPVVSYIEDFYDMYDFNIRYTGYKICDAYPESGDSFYFAMTPRTGKKLLVLEFNASNVSGADAELDMFSKDSSFKIKVNGENEQYALSTLLLNDLATYKGVIPAGQSETLVLVGEVDEDLASNITSIGVSTQSESKNATIQLD